MGVVNEFDAERFVCGCCRNRATLVNTPGSTAMVGRRSAFRFGKKLPKTVALPTFPR
jgi:hypothetical protein